MSHDLLDAHELSTSSSPHLTPTPTGSSDAGSGSESGDLLRPRRPTSFYPNTKLSPKPLKPFSRSAAKRESVMALGSIEHLQHYFTKTGLAAPSDPLKKPHHGLVPAIGGAGMSIAPPTINLPPTDLPPTPVLPTPQTRPSFPQFLKTYDVNPESLKPGVIEDLDDVAHAWRIGDATAAVRSPGKFDVLGVLKTTTRTIRAIRNYVVSLPDDSVSTLREEYRSKIAAVGPAPKRAAASPARRGVGGADPLALIRRAALEVLTVLRALEEAARLPLSDDAYDAQSEHDQEHGFGSPLLLPRVASPSDMSAVSSTDGDGTFAFSLVKVNVNGREESIPVWEEEEDVFADVGDEDERAKRDHWDERLVLQSGWLYRQDIQAEELTAERNAVSRYLDTVDEVLFGGRKGGVRGWEVERERMAKRERAEREAKMKGRRSSSGERSAAAAAPARRVSANMLQALREITVSEEPEEMLPEEATPAPDDEDSVDDDDLPGWAKRTTFTSDDLGRVHAVLTDLLPSTLLPVLPQVTSSRTPLLQALSSGQLLCEAYNVGIRRSRKPWGYVSRDSIHDLVTLESSTEHDETEDKTKRGWTFRRVDNLRIWAAALKLRYMLPVITPAPAGSKSGVGTSNNSTPLTTPSPSLPQKFSVPEPPIYFDALLVARKEEGWEDMLEGAVMRWMQCVVDEKRGER